jgi:hypothetical protein
MYQASISVDTGVVKGSGKSKRQKRIGNDRRRFLKFPFLIPHPSSPSPIPHPHPFILK